MGGLKVLAAGALALAALAAGRATAGGDGWDGGSGQGDGRSWSPERSAEDWSAQDRWGDADQGRGAYDADLGPPPGGYDREGLRDIRRDRAWREDIGPEDMTVPGDFFADSGGVGPDESVYDSGGGVYVVGGGEAGAGAGAFAFASANASVCIHGGFFFLQPHFVPHHGGGCGCGGKR